MKNTLSDLNNYLFETLERYKLGSLFDGSGGFPLSGALCGIEPVWAAEVEPYPIAVTRTRFPNMKHLGDISKINGAEIEPVDIITFGSPCQDLSVAGKRAGLKHEANGDEETTRSGLFMEAVRIIKEMREATNGNYPRFALWENVPGAFSSNNGNDFRVVCEELIKIVEPTAFMPPVPKNGWAYADSYVGDGWSLAYRTFDAQYWGVPQRRRRIHLVTDFRGECAGKVLFERQGVRGYFAEGGTPWQGTACHAEDRTGAADQEGDGEGTTRGRGLDAVTPYTLKIRSGCEGGGKGALVQTDKSATLATNNDQYPFQPVTFEPGIAQREGGHIYEGVSGTLRANAGDNRMAVAMIDSIGGQAERGWEGETAPTLKASHYKFAPCVAYAVENHPADSRVDIDDSGKVQTLTSRMGTGGGNVPMVMEPKVYESHPMDSRIKELDDTAPTVSVKWHKGAADTPLVVEDKPVYCLQGNGIDRPAVAYCTDVGFFGSHEEVAPTILARGYKDPHPVSYPQGIQYIVRRLTPTECARLQGFADRWGDIEKKDSFTEEEFRFWHDVRNTHAAINGKKVQDYTATQMLTWYNKLHTDSAEYKMWGNGIALPPALYCMQGIVDALNAEEDE
jgi:DNA (cytosine-5)-methyltransferase 1